MKLRNKTFIVIGITLISLLVVIFIALKYIVLRSFIDLENQAYKQDVIKVINTLNGEIDTLDMNADQYASWDDTYNFVLNKHDRYIKDNANISNYRSVNVNTMIFLNVSGEIVYSKGLNLETGHEIPSPGTLQKHLLADSILLKHLSIESSHKGIVILPEGPMLIAAQPVLTSEFQGPISGTVILGRYLDKVEIERIETQSKLQVSILSIKELAITPEILEKLTSSKEYGEIIVEPIDEKTSSCYALLRDIYGKPALVLRVNMPRLIYQQGKESVLFFIICIAGAGLILGLVMVKLLGKVVLSRLERVSSKVKQIGASGALNQRIEDQQQDEIGQLTNSINEMLGELEQSYKKIRWNEALLRSIAEASPFAILVVDGQDDKVLYFNERFIDICKLYEQREDILQGSIKYQDIVTKALPHIKNHELLITAAENKKKGQIQGVEEIELNFVDGRTIQRFSNEMRDEAGRSIGRLYMFADFTERRQMENQLIHFSLYDSLTGACNRTFFEQEMAHLNQETSVGLILCDVDGLKFVNDTLGHNVGDRMLISASEVLRTATDGQGILARIGGDEFAIILPGETRTGVEKIIGEIRATLEQYNNANPDLPLSISVGFSFKEDCTQSMGETFKEADNNMYREKLHQTQSNRSTLVQTLMKALEARDYITEGHGDRLQEWVANLALAIGYPSSKINDLRLFAHFHDLGKVGVPDSILFKNGPLNPNETKEMQRHSEIGYRIAKTAPELLPIADWIFKHHEWWNGNGYPLGLKGEEIPLECRILAICDAFDAMTNDRPYRMALDINQAINELKRCSGQQFDPELADVFIKVLDSDIERSV